MPDRIISILGCGWLGLPLARHLIGRGHCVKGSTTTPEKLEVLQAAGVEPFLLALDPDLEGDRLAAFFDADVLFLNVPPSRRRPDVESFVAAQTEAVVRALHASSIDFVVFASSTSVYADVGRRVREADAGTPPPPKASGRALLAAERRLLSDDRFDATVLRFAGLYAEDRHPGRFLAGRTGLSGGASLVNLVHRDDCIAVVTQVIEEDVCGEAFNVCADEHPTRQVLYTRAARHLGLEPPAFADEAASSFKIVDNQKLKRRLGYTFLHPDPLADVSF